ncbi:hypothetical protein ES703_54298 [subsurface metagenome]
MVWRIICGHIAAIAGCYLTAWGINLLPVSTATPADIFGKPLFWGLFAILGAFCFFFPAMLISIKGKK